MALWNLPGGGLAAPDFTLETGGEQKRYLATASSTTHTKGAWIEVFAATSGPMVGIFLWPQGTTSAGGVDSGLLLDIGFGAAGQEKVLVADVQLGYHITGWAGDARKVWYFPVAAPEGVRLAVRAQAVISSDSIAISVLPVIGETGAPATGGGRCTTYGANAATSKGVTVTSGTNTWGSWVPIVASTTDPVDALAVSVGVSTLTATADVHLLQIGVGGTGAEQPIGVVVPFTVTASEDIILAYCGVFPTAHTIPEGAQLSARISGSTADDFGVHLHAITY